MSGSRVRFVSGPGLGMTPTTPANRVPRRPPKRLCATPRPRGPDTGVRQTTTCRPRATLRQEKAATPKTGETEELHDHRQAGTQGPGGPSERARTGDHPDVQRAGEPTGHLPAAQGSVPDGT